MDPKIDVTAIYNRVESEFNSIIAKKDYDALLRIYNRKTLVVQVTNALGLKAGELTELVLRLIRGNRREEVTAAVKKQLGSFGATKI